MPLAFHRRLALARRVLDVQWFQPATALWRLYEVEVVRERLRVSGRSLDLGCGDGSLARPLLDAGGPARWIGLDVEPREVAIAGRSGWYGAVGAASAEALPLRGGSIDVVFANSALEHMTRPAPRDVQLRARPSRALGGLSFALLLPVLLWTAAEGRPRVTAGLYLEAERTGGP